MKTKKTARRWAKRAYRLRNWSEYTKALRQRGSLSLWVDEQALSGWLNKDKTGTRGASDTYSDSAILCALTLKQVYHLPLGATQGLLGVSFPVPDYTTLSRRAQRLEVALPGLVRVFIYLRHLHSHFVEDFELPGVSGI